MQLQELMTHINNNPSILSLTFENILCFHRIARLVKEHIQVYSSSYEKPPGNLPGSVTQMLAKVLNYSNSVINQLWEIFKESIWNTQEEVYSDQDIVLLNTHGILYNIGKCELT